MNPIQNQVDAWKAFNRAIEASKTFIADMILYYDGNNPHVIQALSDKLIHMVDTLGQPQSALEMVERICKDRMFTYTVHRNQWNITENVTKYKSGIWNRNKKHFEKIKKGHFRWNQDNIYKLDRNDIQYLTDYFSGVKMEKSKVFPFNVICIRDPQRFEGCLAIELVTSANNTYRMVRYDDGKIICNWEMKPIEGKKKKILEKYFLQYLTCIS